MGDDVCNHGSGRQPRDWNGRADWRTDRLLWTENTDAGAQQRWPEVGRRLNWGDMVLKVRSGGE